jgi:hypothetical protein
VLSPRGVRALIALMLVLATLGCTVNADARPDRTRRPRPSPTAGVPSATFPSTRPEAEPSPTLNPASIPLRRALAYSGRTSGAQPPVRLTAGRYLAEWSASGTGGLCVFRATLEPLAGGDPEVIPGSQAPTGMTIYGGSEIELATGAYEVRVVGRSCRWRLNVDPIVESTT